MVHYAIVGFGNAGYHAARAIRARYPQGEIHILSDQTFPPANPMLTTYYVKGALDWPGLFPYGSLEELSRSMKLHLHMGRRVRRVHPVQRELELAGGERIEYGQCRICTGASAFLPPAEGMDLANVCCVRAPQDARRLKNALETQRLRSILVVGASMVGIKVVELADQYGIACTLADGAPHLFALAAFQDTAERIERYLKSRGISLAFSAMLDKIVQSPKAPSGVLTAIMKDGRQLPADLIVVCIGARANMELVRGTPVATGRGILVDRGMRTNVPGLYAAGDCCEGYKLQSKEQRNIGLWAMRAIRAVQPAQIWRVRMSRSTIRSCTTSATLWALIFWAWGISSIRSRETDTAVGSAGRFISRRWKVRTARSRGLTSWAGRL